MSLQKEIYRKLYLARAAEVAIQKYYHENDMKTPMHMSFGQEFVPAGVCQALRTEDQVFGTYRSHALYLSKSGNLVRFFGEMYGRVNGMVNGKAGSMHMSDAENGFMGASAIVASTIPVAIGAAFANKFNKTDRIVAPFFGDGAIDEGNFWESLNIAASKRLPVLFVLEDNGFAVHTTTSARHGYKSIIDIVNQFNVAYTGNVFAEANMDAEGVYNMTKEAIDAMRTFDKPAFLRFEVERGLEHVGINEDYTVGYRTKSTAKDCVALYREKLTLTEALQIEIEIQAEIEYAIQRAKAADFPSDEQLYEGIFACER